MYYYLVLGRAVDERWWILQRAGQAAFVISGRGQEAAQVGAGFALERGVDWVHPYYRDVALVLTLGMTPRDVFLDIMAKAEAPSSGGRQMPAHWGNPSLRIVSGSSPVMTQAPQACGIALAARLRGEASVVLTTFGEGATAGGDFHEALNFASIHKLPVIFLCQNNRYAISVPAHKEMPVPSVADRACAYAMPGVAVDGNDVLAVYDVVRQAVQRARRGEGPTLIEANTYQTVPHSSDDDDRRYRPRAEVEEWLQKDPIERFRRYLEEQHILSAEVDQAIRARVSREVDEATEYARAAPYPRPEEALKHVFAHDAGMVMGEGGEGDGDEDAH
jgi:2-oxoisovalerate dehydrogenase E1 component alpha subunit